MRRRRLWVWGGIAVAVAATSLTACDGSPLNPFRMEASEVEHIELPADAPLGLEIGIVSPGLCYTGRGSLTCSDSACMEKRPEEKNDDIEARSMVVAIAE